MSNKSIEIEIEYKSLTNSEIISLLDVYLTEFCHRSELLWAQVHKFFYAALVITMLPIVQQY